MMKKLFSTYSILVAVGVFIIVVIVSMWLKGSLSQKEENSVASSLSAVSQNTDVSDTPVTPTAADSEMKAVWVPYMSLDMSREADQSEAGFQKKFDEIVAGAKEKGMNALIVQVRPFGDALYDSELFPWSSILSGTQGVDPGYDPLEYMVSASHKAGLEIHAWVNPLRIQIKNSPSIYLRITHTIFGKMIQIKRAGQWIGERLAESITTRLMRKSAGTLRMVCWKL